VGNNVFGLSLAPHGAWVTVSLFMAKIIESLHNAPISPEACQAVPATAFNIRFDPR
jgi:hypothetical protein